MDKYLKDKKAADIVFENTLNLLSDSEREEIIEIFCDEFNTKYKQIDRESESIKKTKQSFFKKSEINDNKSI